MWSQLLMRSQSTRSHLSQGNLRCYFKPLPPHLTLLSCVTYKLSSQQIAPFSCYFAVWCSCSEARWGASQFWTVPGMIVYHLSRYPALRRSPGSLIPPKNAVSVRKQGGMDESGVSMHCWSRRWAQRTFSGSQSWQVQFWVWQWRYSPRALRGAGSAMCCGSWLSPTLPAWRTICLAETLLLSCRCRLFPVPLRRPAETSLLQHDVYARLSTQMSCEVVLTRRDSNGNEFFRPAQHVITSRLHSLNPPRACKPLSCSRTTALPVFDRALRTTFFMDQVWFLLVNSPIWSQTSEVLYFYLFW